MVRSAKQVYRLTGRAAMYSPGAPSLGHEIERRFWQQIATGITSENACISSGRLALVPLSWRHATIHVQTYCGAILVVC